MWCTRQGHRPQRGFRVPAVLVRADMEEDTEICASGVRWVCCESVVARHVGHQRALAACTT